MDQEYPYIDRCNGIINTAHPLTSERVRDFQPPWRTVFIYKCPECGGITRLRASSFSGSTPVPGKGGIVCGRYIQQS